MNDAQVDPLIKRAIADSRDAARFNRLNKLLVELAAALDPFPNFMGVSTIQAVKLSPPAFQIRITAVWWCAPTVNCVSLFCE